MVVATMSIGIQESSLSSTSSRVSYHVFLSFRGRDTRKGFTDHLHTALLAAGIRTFRDDDELERGEKVDAELERAIQESKVSLIVFSTDYASSKWCLDELVRILERRAFGLRVVPVFYDVEPSVVEKQRESFGESFAKHEEKFNEMVKEKREEGLKRMETWRAALQEVANLGGMVLKNQANGHEAKFIREIIKEVEKKLKRTVLSVALHPVGIESRVESINSWLQDGSTNARIGVVCGMGGIGKTTIAKVAYNLNFEQFEVSSFLANIREMSEKSDGLVCLQRQFILDVTNGKMKKMSSVDQGIIQLKDAVNGKKVLLVLDDVDQDEHLQAFIGIPDMFSNGSKILVTTRREKLLKPEEVSKMWKIKELNDDESLQLFSWHAFGQEQPPEIHLEHSKCVIQHCGGLPLALQVLGFSLAGRDTEVWKSSLEKLEAVLHNKIRKTLETSYRSLPDDHDKNLFLHIASSYVGKDKDEVAKILEESEFYTPVGIQNLIDSGLLTIDNDNKLMMHQLLQDMGKQIIRYQSNYKPAKHNLLENGSRTVEAAKNTPLLKKHDQTILNVGGGKRRHRDEFDEYFLPNREHSLKRRINSFFSWLSFTKLFGG